MSHAASITSVEASQNSALRLRCRHCGAEWVIVVANLWAPMIRSVHVRVSGRVQGVGYRAFVERVATRLSLRGWVRNRHEGSVEAVFSGEDDAIASMIAALEQGPRLAAVEDVAVADVDDEDIPANFVVRPSA
jgi:acylphosphatase